MFRLNRLRAARKPFPFGISSKFAVQNLLLGSKNADFPDCVHISGVPEHAYRVLDAPPPEAYALNTREALRQKNIISL